MYEWSRQWIENRQLSAESTVGLLELPQDEDCDY